MAQRWRRALRACPGSGRFAGRVTRDPVDEPREHQSVERRDRVPVGAAEEPAWAEAGGLHEQRSAGDWFYRPLEPGFPGEPHLGSQHEQPIGFEVLDAPEVHGLTDRKAVGVATAASKAWPARDLVHQTPRLPEHLTPIPALLTTDPAHCLPGAMRIGGHHGGAHVGELGTASPAGVGCRRLPHGRGRIIELRRDVAHRGPADAYPNLTLKKIPQAVLAKCEWGRDDYSLAVRDLPERPVVVPDQADIFGGGGDS